jgi:hypothetical protein
MSNQLKIHSRVSSIFNLIITILVIITGLLIIQLSVLSGLGLIIAGLMISQKIRAIISNKFPNISSKTLMSFNKWAFLLIILSLGYLMIEEGKQQDREIWNKGKVSILKNINDKIDSNKLLDASFSINQYETAAADDSDFKAIKEKYIAAKKADEERKKKKVEADLANQERIKKEAEASQTISAVNNGGSNRVIAIVGQRADLGNGDFFTLDSQTAFDINGQYIQNPTINHIQIGDRCTHKRSYRLASDRVSCSR